LSAYLLTWNPEKWAWADAKLDVADVSGARQREHEWSCGNRKSLPVGSRVFLIRQRTQVRGIVGVGTSTREPKEGPHFVDSRAAAGDTAMYVRMRFDALVDPYGPSLLDIDTLSPRLRDGVNWGTQASGISVPDELAAELDAAWEQHLGKPLAPPTDSRESQERSTSVARRKARDSAFSREVRARSQGRCAVCAVDIDYEALGILEAAHIKSVEADGPDDLSNALPLCPTHHGLFDEFHWTIEAGRVVVSASVPNSLKATFSVKLKQPWQLARPNVVWHRRQSARRLT
jgi:5-methylcytosine-specific restriction enzyme A